MKKILLIEDNTEVRENISEILLLANYNVVTAPNGKVGVEKAISEKPDLIICDIMMPELDGYGVLHILVKNPETSGIPFIFLTAKAEKTDIRKGMLLGADDYLTKPFDDTELLNAIEVRLHKKQLTQKKYENTENGLNLFMSDVRQMLAIENLGKDQTSKSVRKKTILFDEGDMPTHLYFLKSGQVKIFRSHPDGKELITTIYNDGDFFGFESILQNTPHQESAIALTDSALVTIPKSDFIALVHTHPDIAKSFIGLLCKKISERESQLLHLAYNSIRQRTAEALLKLGDYDKNSVINISREDLAKVVGTATESVIRVLSDFKDENLVDVVGGKIKIKEHSKLEQVVRWNVARV